MSLEDEVFRIGKQLEKIVVQEKGVSYSTTNNLFVGHVHH
jgi:hypothetical protein